MRTSTQDLFHPYAALFYQLGVKYVVWHVLFCKRALCVLLGARVSPNSLFLGLIYYPYSSPCSVHPHSTHPLPCLTSLPPTCSSQCLSAHQHMGDLCSLSAGRSTVLVSRGSFTTTIKQFSLVQWNTKQINE